MSSIVINSVTFSGTPLAPGTPWKPVKIAVDVRKIGRLLEAANGTPHWIDRGSKRTWTIDWEKANEATRAAVRTIRLLTTTFAFTDEHGVAYTVLTTGEDNHTEGSSFTDAANTVYYDFSLTLREA